METPDEVPLKMNWLYESLSTWRPNESTGPTAGPSSDLLQASSTPDPIDQTKCRSTFRKMPADLMTLAETVPSPRGFSSRSTSKDGNDSTRQGSFFERIRRPLKLQSIQERLESYLAEMRTCAANLEGSISEAERSDRRNRKLVRDSIQRLRRIAEYSLVPLARQYGQLLIFRGELKLRIQRRCLAAVRDRIALVVEALVQENAVQRGALHTSGTRWYAGKDFFRSGEDLFLDVIEVVQSFRQLHSVDELLDTLVVARSLFPETDNASWSDIPCLPPMPLLSDRSRLLHQLLRATKPEYDAGTVTWHKWDETRQLKFKNMFIDDRTLEGGLINRFLDNFTRTLPGFSAASVVGFHEDLLKLIQKSYGVEESDIGKVALFLARLLYSMIAEYCLGREAAANRERDKKFRQQVMWLREVSQEKLDINPKYISTQEIDWLPEEEGPYHVACEHLADMSYHVVPLDMLYCVIQTAQSIYSVAEASAREQESSFVNDKRASPDPISADDFFPIFLYVVIHSELADPFTCLSYIQHYSSAEEHRASECAYYMTTLESALSFVTDITPGRLFMHSQSQSKMSDASLTLTTTQTSEEPDGQEDDEEQEEEAEEEEEDESSVNEEQEQACEITSIAEYVVDAVPLSPRSV
mmetsp:Transcript_23995/g.39431  ORF Transcript_23995/g.39431 Transcript_23995/m.39431 type:complete len:641 (+) Transcript_23995:143-2065(+)